ncbi:hypothetical protein J4230_05480 [Candidatus Woesearchaeota archaeon]|nr:hypothetical protein [Candidatus Woesearchaeota archaeon]
MIVRRCSTKGAFEAIPEKNINLNLYKIKLKYETIADLPILVLIKYNNYEITCYKNGKLIIRKCEIKEEAEKIANKIYEDAK